jgi:hypothetical protein
MIRCNRNILPWAGLKVFLKPDQANGKATTLPLHQAAHCTRVTLNEMQKREVVCFPRTCTLDKVKSLQLDVVLLSGRSGSNEWSIGI